VSNTYLLDALTGSSVVRDEVADDPTRTTADLVDRFGYAKNVARILVADSEEGHTVWLSTHHRALANERAKQPLAELLDALSDLGLFWRDVARICGVSVPALRKWRQGQPATGENRRRVAETVAYCDIASDLYLVGDVAGWMNTPIHPAAPLTALDLVADERIDLALRLVSERDIDPERVLDEYDPDWRERYRSAVEVFSGPDGLPGVRLREGSD